MRTTLTLDDDVVALVREEMERAGTPFKQVVNQAIRLGFRAGMAPERRQPFRTRPHAFGFKPGVDLDKLNQLADELEAEAFRDQHLSQA
ncbi:MAG: type II toxin-antitoxin system antitoxin VapB33 [Chloroflexota bacterium]